MCDALLALKVQHSDERLERLLAILGTVSQADSLLRLGHGLRAVKLEADAGLEGADYGAALRARREAWLADALAASHPVR